MPGHEEGQTVRGVIGTATRRGCRRHPGPGARGCNGEVVGFLAAGDPAASLAATAGWGLSLPAFAAFPGRVADGGGCMGAGDSSGCPVAARQG